MLLVSFFNLGAWGSVYPFTSELYPTKLRGKSFGLAEGVGNIIKNEALFLAKVHPLSIIEKIPENVLRNIILQTRNFSLKFLETRLNNESLKKYLNVYRIKNCKYCNNNIKIKKLGKLNRISFYCEKCQILYS
jgi:formamidopyrimidine-DNA glycosylase